MDDYEYAQQMQMIDHLGIHMNADGIAAASWGNVVSRHRESKRWAARGLTAASVGIQGAQIGTGTGALALMMGAAASATGIGLVAAGGAATVASMALGAKSAVSTNRILGHLEELYQKRESFQCKLHVHDPRTYRLHGLVSDYILPWIIRQKKHKFGKKVVSSLGLGLAVGVWSAGRKVYKAAKGTLGKERHWYANALAVHLLTADCPLSEQIVTALYSKEELIWLMGQDSETITPLLEDKMKSV